MKLIFVGPQASGKGTYGKIIADKLGLCHISMGDLLRGYSGKYKKQIDEAINAGNMISNELVLQILQERMSYPDCKKGIILDGFPRNLEQAKALEKIIIIDKVIETSVPEEVTLKRLGGRWNCPKCGTAYNVVTEPKPKTSGICDKDGTKLFQRADDLNTEAIKKRLKTYHEETEPILKFYKDKGKTARVDASGKISEVVEDILKVLKVLKK